MPSRVTSDKKFLKHTFEESTQNSTLNIRARVFFFQVEDVDLARWNVHKVFA